jgi:hypothetical protein
MGSGLFSLAIGLAVYFYGGYMTKKGREAERVTMARFQRKG